jgi:hypothetical protein
MRSVHVHSNGIPPEVRDALGEAIRAAMGDREGDWEGSITNDPDNNAWDVELQGPNQFHWARRFSGADRDPLVISAAINSGITTDPKVA